jgi:hypothetical protein
VNIIGHDTALLRSILCEPLDPPHEMKRLHAIERAALRVINTRRKGIVTDKSALDLLDAALEAQ